MYTEYLKTLAKLSEGLDELAKVGEDKQTGLSTPYLGGTVDVLLEGEVCGHFVFEDEWVIYHDDASKEHCGCSK